MTVKLWGALNGTSWTALDGTPWTGAAIAPASLPDTSFTVEFAWGADITAPSSSWVWTDVTADILTTSGTNTTIAQQSQTTTAPPGQMTLTLKNVSNDYSQYNPMSSNWPNVREGTPIRRRVCVNGTWSVRFFGSVVGFKPSFDETGNYAVAIVTAAGATRKITLKSNNVPLRSALERYITKQSTLLEYWPMEDGTSSATITNAENATNPMTFSGAITFASDNGIMGSDPLPVFSATTAFNAALINQPTSTGWQVDFHTHVPAAVGSDTTLIQIGSTGTVALWKVVMLSGGTSFTISGMGTAGTTLTSLTFSFDVTAPGFGEWIHWTFAAKSSGGNIVWGFYYSPSNNGGSSFTGTTSLVGVLGHPVSIYNTAQATLAGTGYGHIAFLDTYLSANINNAAQGFIRESPSDRLSRLCREQGIEYQQVGFYDSSTTMGPQGSDTFINLIRQCEITDAGFVYDGLSAGIQYQPISQRYDQISVFTVNALIGELMPPFDPLPDDFGRVNYSKVTRQGGSSAIFEDDTGPLGINIVGRYEGSPSPNPNYYDDGPLANRARWEVRRGTIQGFRYPTAIIDVRKIPSRAAAIASFTPGLHFSVLPPYPAQIPRDTIHLCAVGWTEVMSQTTWTITYNCVNQDAYNVWKVGDAQLGRLGTNGHTLATTVTAGASSISLVTPTASQLWTTTATFPADFPLTLMIDGIKLIVTAITGSSSPQTATLDVSTPVPRTILGGSAVAIWKNGTIKL